MPSSAENPPETQPSVMANDIKIKASSSRKMVEIDRISNDAALSTLAPVLVDPSF